uniref:RNA-binding protein squid n=1 Tax=Steinernema glaseri TaxID=37863 RepID=A0A1I7YLE6_9BILA
MHSESLMLPTRQHLQPRYDIPFLSAAPLPSTGRGSIINMDNQDKNSQEVKVNGNAENAPTANVSNNTDNANNNKNESSNKGNEDRKIFVGGIAYDVTNDDLTQHFSTFGEVTQAQVKYDRITGRSRGFAFVEFATGEGCKQALVEREQTIKNKSVEVKPAKSRENKKVFVGGLPADFPEEDLRAHFEAYGKVEDIEWPFDKQTKTKRNFAFIVFEEEEAADKASSIAKQTFGSRDCDVKKAVPQGKRNGMRLAGNMRVPFAGGRAGIPGPAANWGYGASTWNQAGGIPYMPSNGQWTPEWFSQNNYYPNSGHHFGGYNGVTANGYDNYAQNGASARPSNNQRFPQPTAQQF